MSRQNFDVAELRELIRHMTQEEREDLHQTLIGGSINAEQLSFHEMCRLQHLLEKLEDEWPYCKHGEDVTLLELLVAFDDDEMGDLLLLYRLGHGNERPPEHPVIDHETYAFDLAGKKKRLPNGGWTNQHPAAPRWTPDQSLREAQRIARSASATT